MVVEPLVWEAAADVPEVSLETACPFSRCGAPSLHVFLAPPQTVGVRVQVLTGFLLVVALPSRYLPALAWKLGLWVGARLDPADKMFSGVWF